MKSTGGTLACKPFAEKSVKPFQNKGFISVSQKTELTELTVIYGNSGVSGVPFAVSAGQKVWVKGESFSTPWAKAILRVPGTEEEVILVPYSEIVLLGDSVSPPAND